PQLSSGDDGRVDSAELPPLVKSAVRVEHRVEQVSHPNLPVSTKCRFWAYHATARGRVRQGPKFLQRFGRGAPSLSVIQEHMMTFGVRREETVPMKLEHDDLRIGHVVHSQAITRLRTAPQCAEPFTDRGQVSS